LKYLEVKKVFIFLSLFIFAAESNAQSIDGLLDNVLSLQEKGDKKA
jgi:hypothetical protein